MTGISYTIFSPRYFVLLRVEADLAGNLIHRTSKFVGVWLMFACCLAGNLVHRTSKLVGVWLTFLCCLAGNLVHPTSKLVGVWLTFLCCLAGNLVHPTSKLVGGLAVHFAFFNFHSSTAAAFPQTRSLIVLSSRLRRSLQNSLIDADRRGRRDLVKRAHSADSVPGIGIERHLAFAFVPLQEPGNE